MDRSGVPYEIASWNPWVSTHKHSFSRSMHPHDPSDQLDNDYRALSSQDFVIFVPLKVPPLLRWTDTSFFAHLSEINSLSKSISSHQKPNSKRSSTQQGIRCYLNCLTCVHPSTTFSPWLSISGSITVEGQCTATGILLGRRGERNVTINVTAYEMQHPSCISQHHQPKKNKMGQIFCSKRYYTNSNS
jgi:hypothetical protein